MTPLSPCSSRIARIFRTVIKTKLSGRASRSAEIIRFMVLLVSSGYSPSDDQKIARDAMRRGWAGQE
jgi:hypothetical protein